MTFDDTLDNQQIVLLDPATDTPIGTMDKLAAHKEGRYHAAISVLLIDAEGRHILQKRADMKYHAPGLWSNACCSHPFPGETDETAAVRRLREELGIDCKPRHFGTIRYRASVAAPTSIDARLIEHEKVELFGAIYSGPLRPNKFEVSAVKSEFLQLPDADTTNLTPWFILYLNRFGDKMNEVIQENNIYDFGYHEIS